MNFWTRPGPSRRRLMMVTENIPGPIQVDAILMKGFIRFDELIYKSSIECAKTSGPSSKPPSED